MRSRKRYVRLTVQLETKIGNINGFKRTGYGFCSRVLPASVKLWLRSVSQMHVHCTAIHWETHCEPFLGLGGTTDVARRSCERGSNVTRATCNRVSARGAQVEMSANNNMEPS